MEKLMICSVVWKLGLLQEYIINAIQNCLKFDEYTLASQ